MERLGSAQGGARMRRTTPDITCIRCKAVPSNEPDNRGTLRNCANGLSGVFPGAESTHTPFPPTDGRLLGERLGSSGVLPPKGAPALGVGTVPRGEP